MRALMHNLCQNHESNSMCINRKYLRRYTWALPVLAWPSNRADCRNLAAICIATCFDRERPCPHRQMARAHGRTNGEAMPRNEPSSALVRAMCYNNQRGQGALRQDHQPPPPVRKSRMKRSCSERELRLCELSMDKPRGDDGLVHSSTESYPSPGPCVNENRWISRGSSHLRSTVAVPGSRTDATVAARRYDGLRSEVLARRPALGSLFSSR